VTARSISRRDGNGFLASRSSSMRNSVSSRTTSSGSIPSASNRQTAIRWSSALSGPVASAPAGPATTIMLATSEIILRTSEHHITGY
jgi:hypothetical protein